MLTTVTRNEASDYMTDSVRNGDMHLQGIGTGRKYFSVRLNDDGTTSLFWVQIDHSN